MDLKRFSRDFFMLLTMDRGVLGRRSMVAAAAVEVEVDGVRAGGSQGDDGVEGGAGEDDDAEAADTDDWRSLLLADATESWRDAGWKGSWWWWWKFICWWTNAAVSSEKESGPSESSMDRSSEMNDLRTSSMDCEERRLGVALGTAAALAVTSESVLDM